jgi:hypothetical protein
MRRTASVYPYIVVLKNKQRPAILGTGLLMAVTAIALFVWRAYQPDGSGMNWMGSATVAILTGRNLYEMHHGKTTRFKPVYIVSAIGLAAFAPHSAFSVLYILLAWLEKQALAAQEIGFDEKEIVINGLWAKKIQWSDLNNVVIKDGFLTIDFKNNRLYQKETDDLEDDEYDGEEDEFNSWCVRQLATHEVSPQK